MIAYLDNSATTQSSIEVVEAMEQALREEYFNPSSLYAPAMRAEKAMNACRNEIRQALHTPSGQVVFTSGGTEANNLAIIGSVSAMHGPQRILVSQTEHPSVLGACEALEAAGHTVIRFPVDRQGQPVWETVEGAMREGVSLLSCMQVNNETGAMPDLARLSAMLRSLCPGALFHVDGVQGFLRVPMQASLADLYTLSGHKIHGPKGVGALWIRSGVRLKPRALGGGQEGGLRSGTENTPGIIGLGAAIRAMPGNAADVLAARKALLLGEIRSRIPDVRINGPLPEDAAPHILNLTFPGVRGEVLLHALEEAGVYVSTGSACSSKKRKLSPVLLAMGVPANDCEGALRFSLSPHTSEEEILYAAEQAGKAYELLKRFRRK
ncbi:MAG: cysteine desulfurase [Clostridia bacterium]|nr:cysteine desulfurase [Clostridia bacterium]